MKKNTEDKKGEGIIGEDRETLEKTPSPRFCRISEFFLKIFNKGNFHKNTKISEKNKFETEIQKI